MKQDRSFIVLVPLIAIQACSSQNFGDGESADGGSDASSSGGSGGEGTGGGIADHINLRRAGDENDSIVETGLTEPDPDNRMRLEIEYFD